jgi:apolipoprotein N-acyltransferase
MKVAARSKLLRLCASAALAGALLFLSDYPLHAWPLQAVALLPLFVALGRWCASARAAALAGFVLGGCYTAPLAVVLEFPPAMGAPLALYIAALWLLLAALAWRVLRWPSPLGPLAAGAVAVVVEWIGFSVVPVWGTAQTFVRVWTASPFAVQLVALTGVLGLVFVIVAGQALAARLLTAAERRRSALALVLLVGATAGWSAWRWTRPRPARLRVAALGWTAADLDRARASWPLALYDRLYEPLVRKAAREGAALVVSPEVGFALATREKEIVLERAARLARELRVALALGYFDRERNDNRVLLLGRDGAPAGEYVKTHLIPFVEQYRAGSGRLVTTQVGSFTVGAMICQDDNFTDLARGYGRRGAQLLVVPTNDWAQVKDYHLENSLFRPVENGYGVARAASNGVSAIVSPRGELLARRDHFRDGPGMAIATVALGEGGAPYSWAGDWPVLALSVVGLGAAALARRRRS